jgi:hypothetical protein
MLRLATQLIARVTRKRALIAKDGLAICTECLALCLLIVGTRDES